MANLNRIDDWLRRFHALETAVAARGRDDLRPLVTALRRIAQNGPAAIAEALPALTATAEEIEVCLANERRYVLESGVDALLPVRRAESVPPGPWSGDEDGESWAARLRETFVTAPPEAMQEAVASSRRLTQRPLAGPAVSVLSGDVLPGLVDDLTALLLRTGESGALLLSHATTEVSLYFEAGVLVDATAVSPGLTHDAPLSSEQGNRAALRALGLTEGRFTFLRGARSTQQRITYGLERLRELAAGAERLDTARGS